MENMNNYFQNQRCLLPVNIWSTWIPVNMDDVEGGSLQPLASSLRWIFRIPSADVVSLHPLQCPHIGSHSPNIFGLTPHKLSQYRTNDGRILIVWLLLEAS